MTVRGEPRIRSFWRHPREKSPTAPAELRDAFQQAVERHLVSDVPVGVFLSGGIDSSAVAAAATRAVGAGVTSLSVVFPEHPAHSEAAHARRLAERIGTRHVEVPVENRDVLARVALAVEAMDQPTIDAVNTYIVSHAARQGGLTVALSGLGGDELFGGYSTFREVPKLLRLRRLSAPARGLARPALRLARPFALRPGKILDLMDSSGTLLEAYLIRRRLFSSRQVHLLAPTGTAAGWLSGLPAERQRELASLVAGLEMPDALSALELEVYMGETLLRDTDVMGMAHSLEVRVPLLDTEFSDRALALPASARVPRETPKWAFTEAIMEWLPEENWRRTKQGFAMPWSEWLQGPLRERVEQSLAALPDRAPLLERSALQRLWQMFLSTPGEIGWSRPWSLFVLGEYLERHGLRA